MNRWINARLGAAAIGAVVHAETHPWAGVIQAFRIQID